MPYDLLPLKCKELCSCELSESDCSTMSLKKEGLIFSRRTLHNAVGWSATEFIVLRHKTETWTPASNHEAHNLETHVIRNKLQQRRTLRRAVHREYTDPHKPTHPSFKNDPYMTQGPPYLGDALLTNITAAGLNKCVQSIQLSSIKTNPCLVCRDCQLFKFHFPVEPTSHPQIHRNTNSVTVVPDYQPTCRQVYSKFETAAF